MTLKEFIRTNRTTLDDYIKAKLGHVPRTASCYCSQSGTDHRHEVGRLNDETRREWILNDEPLYRWARAEKVRI